MFRLLKVAMKNILPRPGGWMHIVHNLKCCYTVY